MEETGWRQYLEVDPFFGDIAPSLLSSHDIHRYAALGCLVSNYDEERLLPAGYQMCFAGDLIYWEPRKRGKLKRISLGSIDNLLDPVMSVELLALGKGTIKGSRWNPYYLKLTTPVETRDIETLVRIMNSHRNYFLAYIDELLTDSNMYFTDVNYNEEGSFGFLPHKLSGK